MGTKDGKLKVLWDISAILRELSNDIISPTMYRVEDLFERNSFNGDPEYAMNTDLSKPCIIVQLNETCQKLIDGNHRLYKAKQLRLVDIPCYLLPLDYHAKFIVDYDKTVYEKVLVDFIE
jgi:hypothetical protein